MRKFVNNFIISLVLLSLISCAKPTVVNVTLPDDKNLDCQKLEDALNDAQEFRRKAIGATGNTAGNQARAILFWPALMMTYINAHEAIMASSARSIHLINIMQDKNCKDLDKLVNRFHETYRVQTLKDLAEAYKNLNELYNSGGLTEKEYNIQKHKILGQ